MIWSKESLQNLSEEDLCLKVLVPLFRAMEYQDVRYYHGGVLEQGKDIVMWKSDELRGRVYFAVAVKAERITGSASSTSVVAFQAQQALGSAFVDEQTSEIHSVHEVFVVTSHAITKEGHEALRSAWAGAQVEKHITKISGDTLWQLIERHLPHEAVFASLAEAHKALDDSDPDYGYITQFASNHVNVVVFPKRDDAGPVPVSFEQRFPDTPEGKEQESAFRRFLASGRPVEVLADYLTVTGLPRPIQEMLQQAPGGTFFFGPRRTAKNLVVSLSVERVGTEEIILFPLIEFGANYGGEEEIVLSNEQQSIPYKFWLTISRVESKINIKFDSSQAASSVASYLRALEFESALSQGGKLFFREYETDRIFAASPVPPGLVEPPSSGFLEMMRKLAWIQRQLGIVIPLPEREFFSGEDVADILEIYNIIRSGEFLGEVSEVRVTLNPGALPDVLSKHYDGLLGKMTIVQDYHYELMGTEIVLGAVELTSASVRIDPAEVDALRVAALLPDCSPSVRFVSKEGAFNAKFKDWPRVSGADNSGADLADSYRELA
jgi:hypothetical protein